MGRHSRSRSKDRHKERRDKDKDKDKGRSRDHRERSSRDRARPKEDDRKEKDRRDRSPRDRDHHRREEKQEVRAPSNVNAFEDKIKSIAARAAQGASRWAEPPEALKIRDEQGNISEEFLKSTQGAANSQKQVQHELSQKFNQTLSNPTRSIQPRIDQSRSGLSQAEIENRNRYVGSADPYEQGYYGMPTVQIPSTLPADKAKLMRKIYIPKNNNFNYTGFIIGPKGTNQKRLEEETGCKILVRGKGSQKEGTSTSQADESDELHVLVTADNPETLAKGVQEIEKIIFADESTRNELKRFQLQLNAQLKNSEAHGGLPPEMTGGMDLSHTTPYGPPSNDAVVIAVPKDCIGLVIGRVGHSSLIREVRPFEDYKVSAEPLKFRSLRPTLLDQNTGMSSLKARRKHAQRFAFVLTLRDLGDRFSKLGQSYA